MLVKEYQTGKIYQGKLEKGDDLIKSLTEFAKKNDIKAAKVTAIGAVQEAVISFYDQDKREYFAKEFPQNLEIIHCGGNISLKDGQPIVHAHIALGDEAGKMYGGHLEDGTKVFACEFVIEVLKGESLKRGYDEATGLPLWQK